MNGTEREYVGAYKITALKWGIVGAGKISHDFAAAVRSVDQNEHQVLAIAARKLQDAIAFAGTHLMPIAHGSYKDLAKDANIDIVYVGILNRQHFEVSKMMLEAGKHVLVEKPMCMNLMQTKKLIEIAREKKLFLMEAIWSRFFPAYKRLARELSQKTIGDIIHVGVYHGTTGTNVDRVQKKELGGSVILDIGIYMVNALSVIFKENPEKILCVSKLNEEEVDQSVGVSFLYSGGRIATGAITSLGRLQNELVISGTKGRIKLPQPYHCPEVIEVLDKTYEYPLPESIVRCNYNNSSGLRYEILRIGECLKRGLIECPEMTHKDSEMLAEIMDDLRKKCNVYFPEDIDEENP